MAKAKVTYQFNVGDKAKFKGKEYSGWFNQCRITKRYESYGKPRYVLESAIGNTMDCAEDDVQKRA
jgi:hypothetical protein